MNDTAAQPLRVRLAAALQDRHREVGLRDEREEDTPFLCGLYAEVRAQELAPVVDWSEAQKRAFTDSQLALQREHYRRHYPGAEFLIFELAGVPIGRVYLCAFADTIRLMDIALVEAQRGQGIGTALVRELMQLARERGTTVTLHVEPHNPAQRLYARLGFKFVEQRSVYDFLEWTPDTAS